MCRHLSSGDWLRLREITPEWAAAQPRCRATVLGLIVSTEPPFEVRCKDGRLLPIAKLRLEDGGDPEVSRKRIR